MKHKRDAFRELDDQRRKLNYIHYSCQSLSDENEGYSPRVTSIAVLHHSSSQMYSFSIHLVAEELLIPRLEIEKKYDEIEKRMLEMFFAFVAARPKDHKWIHWNMTNINYGFEALEHRYRCLIHEAPPHIDEDSRYNLSNLLKRKYGNYADDPKMGSLMKMNGGIDRNFLTGEEEVRAFKAQEYIKLHNSTMCMAYFFRDVFTKAVTNKLRTKTNSWRFKINELYSNPIVQIIGMLGVAGSIVALVLQLIK